MLCSLGGRADCLFRHIGMEEGLSQSTVYAILQDRTGFVWMGTKAGLNRFDGTAFKVYRHKTGPYSLGSDYVTALYEAPDGKIWVGTDEGIWIYNPVADAFTHLNQPASNGVRITDNVNLITEHGGKVYIGVNEQGLFVYDLKSHRMANHRLSGHPNISGLGFDHTGRVWIGFFGGGLWSADARLQVLHPFVTADGRQPYAGNIVSAIREVSPGQLFVGADHRGLSVISPERRHFSEVIPQQDGRDLFVRALAVNRHELWAATEQGLFVYNLLTHRQQHYRHNPVNPFSLSDNPLYSLFRDNEGGMWVGSYFGGANYAPARYPLFERFFPLAGTEGTLHGQRVREMVQDRLGQIWIGTEDGGLNCMDPRTGQISLVASSQLFPNIHGLWTGGDYLWVGTFSYGLKVIDIRTHQVVKSYQAGSGPGQLRDNTVFSITRSPKGELYFGTIRGLCRLDSKTGSFVYQRGVPDVLINKVRFDRLGNLWVATQNNGIYLLGAGARQWRNFRKDNHSGLRVDKVLTAFEDSEGRMWFTTQGGGVYRYDAASRQMREVAVSGVSGQTTVLEIVEDRQGCLWLSTYNGIVKYNPQSGQSRTYTSQSALLDNQFNNSSSLIDRSGRVYFGSLNGFIRFQPDALQRGQTVPRLVATELRLGNSLVDNHTPESPLVQNIVFTGRLSLGYDQNSFSLHVVPLSFSRQQMSQMEYLLEGYDKEWQPMRIDNVIAYSNLPAGDYRLRVRIRESNGSWSAKEYRLEVEVKSHPLLSVWARLIYLLLAAAAVWLVVRYLNRRSRRKREEAMRQLEHEKEQELYQSKIHFFTNVAHEIRTPLTLIKGPLENIIKAGKVESKEVKEDLSIMAQNTNRLNDLINQLLDFRKAERDGLKLNYERCNVTKILTGVYDRFRPLMRERGISATISLQDDQLHAYVDHEGFTKIVSNLINNAVKYCASRVMVTLTHGEDDFTLTVANDGTIIPLPLREQIFQPFFRMDAARQSSNNGTGIGLAMARSLADLHNGTLVMDDSETLNVFRLTLPLDQADRIMLPPAPPSDEDDEAEDAVMADGRDTLLLVEDNPQMLEYEKRRLQKDYNILTAADGEEALGVLSRHPVGLIVSDVMMEPMNGFELCRKVKHDINYSHVPFILLTAVTVTAAKMEGMESGADAYIEKPFSMDYLLETIRSLLRSREEIQRAYAGSPFVSSGTVPISQADADFLKRLGEVVSRNISNSDFNVDEMASSMNMSRTSLNRKIRGTLNLSPNSYIRLERLKRAAQLLKEGQSKVNEVCYKVGFSSPSYFTKCFQRQFGLLPKDFIKAPSLSPP